MPPQGLSVVEPPAWVAEASETEAEQGELETALCEFKVAPDRRCGEPMAMLVPLWDAAELEGGPRGVQQTGTFWLHRTVPPYLCDVAWELVPIGVLIRGTCATSPWPRIDPCRECRRLRVQWEMSEIESAADALA